MFRVVDLSINSYRSKKRSVANENVLMFRFDKNINKHCAQASGIIFVLPNQSTTNRHCPIYEDFDETDGRKTNILCKLACMVEDMKITFLTASFFSGLT